MTTHDRWPTGNQAEEVRRIVNRTKAIRWWIDRQIEHGKTDEQIAAELPGAVDFIVGRMTLDELLLVVATARKEAADGAATGRD